MVANSLFGIPPREAQPQWVCGITVSRASSGPNPVSPSLTVSTPDPYIQRGYCYPKDAGSDQGGGSRRWVRAPTVSTRPGRKWPNRRPGKGDWLGEPTLAKERSQVNRLLVLAPNRNNNHGAQLAPFECLASLACGQGSNHQVGWSLSVLFPVIRRVLQRLEAQSSQR